MSSTKPGILTRFTVYFDNYFVGFAGEQKQPQDYRGLDRPVEDWRDHRVDDWLRRRVMGEEEDGPAAA